MQCNYSLIYRNTANYIHSVILIIIISCASLLVLSRSTIVYRFGTMHAEHQLLYNYYWHTVRLASPNEPPDTDHTGEIISFSDVGSGYSTYPRAWYCYTRDPSGVVWQGPGGSELPIVSSRDAVGDELFISGARNPDAVILHRGPTHYSPDGEHCCVRLNTNPNFRRCVTFSEC